MSAAQDDARPAQVLLFVLPTLVVTVVSVRMLPRRVMRFILMSFVQAIYRVKSLHTDRIPMEGGALMICNHVSYIDSLILSTACPRDIRFIIVERRTVIFLLSLFLATIVVIGVMSGLAYAAEKGITHRDLKLSNVLISADGRLLRSWSMQPCFFWDNTILLPSGEVLAAHRAPAASNGTMLASAFRSRSRCASERYSPG